MKFFRTFILLLAIIIALVVLMTVFVHPFLSVNKPIASKNLVIDAWRSGTELETIIEQSKPYKLEKIFVIGQKFENDSQHHAKLASFEQDEYLRWGQKKGPLLLTNSSLIIDLSKLDSIQNDSIKTLTLKASDTQQNNFYAHFCVFLNGILVGSSFVNDSLMEYSYCIDVIRTENLILSVYFDNDYCTEEVDRNLYIESVKINGIGYNIDETNSLITRHRSILTTGFHSEAAQTIQYLKDLNVNPEIIKIVEFEKRSRNQTLAASLKLKEYFNGNLPKDINVSSTGLHARRTLFTYKNVLEMDQVGIFNVQVKMFDQDNWYKSFSGIHNMLDEFASYIYVWFYLNFV